LDAATIAGAALTALLTTCAPDVAPSTIRAIVAAESRGNRYALNDNTTHSRYVPADSATAQAFIRQGHSVDPCRNLRIASGILVADYAAARTVFIEPRLALWHTISAYNTGSPYAGKAYVNRVVAAGSRVSVVPPLDLCIATAYRLDQRPLSHRPQRPYARSGSRNSTISRSPSRTLRIVSSLYGHCAAIPTPVRNDETQARANDVGENSPSDRPA
jgi:type IV secretion system protein VirB1